VDQKKREVEILIGFGDVIVVEKENQRAVTRLKNIKEKLIKNKE